MVRSAVAVTFPISLLLLLASIVVHDSTTGPATAHRVRLMRMSSTTDAVGRRRATVALKDALRDLRNQLSLLNHQVSARLALKDVDLDCLELIGRHGPLSPSALARRAGLHPATMTGILDRLQKGGWIVRERDPEAADRRAVAVRAVRGRNAELFRLYAGMNAAMDDLCAGYSEEELALIAGFLRRATSAGTPPTGGLAKGRTRAFFVVPRGVAPRRVEKGGPYEAPLRRVGRPRAPPLRPA